MKVFDEFKNKPFDEFAVKVEILLMNELISKKDWRVVKHMRAKEVEMLLENITNA